MTSTTAAVSPTTETRSIGRYRLGAVLGHGGMASVYEAEFSAAGGVRKRVAVKLVAPHLAADPVFRNMFLTEARLLAQIEHPHVCALLDFGETDGTYFMAMELLRGASLARLLATEPGSAGLPPALVARVVADAARGLHAAHELRGEGGALAGVVHRDVSPHNVFVCRDGTTKVLDFGVARSDDRPPDERTRTGELKGKPAYMAPEQVRHWAVDRRTDVFALGVVLWEASTGSRLFARDTEMDTMLAVVSAEVPPPSSLRRGYPPALERVVLRALERDPAARFATAEEMANALEQALPAAQGARAAVGAFVQYALGAEPEGAELAAPSDVRTLVDGAPIEHTASRVVRRPTGEHDSSATSPALVSAPVAQLAPSRPTRARRGVLVAAAAVTSAIVVGAALGLPALRDHGAPARGASSIVTWPATAPAKPIATSSSPASAASLAAVPAAVVDTTRAASAPASARAEGMVSAAAPSVGTSAPTSARATRAAAPVRASPATTSRRRSARGSSARAATIAPMTDFEVAH